MATIIYVLEHLTNRRILVHRAYDVYSIGSEDKRVTEFSRPQYVVAVIGHPNNQMVTKFLKIHSLKFGNPEMNQLLTTEDLDFRSY